MGGVAEDELIHRVAAGDRTSFDAVARRHYPGLLEFLRRMVGAEADDVVQKAFLQAWRGLGTYDPTRPFKPWLFAIALNEARKHFRDESPRAPSLEMPIGPPLQTEIAGTDEARRRVRALVSDLPEDQRAAMLLRFQEGFSPAEIAEIEGVSPNAIRIRLSRALQALRQRLREGQE